MVIAKILGLGAIVALLAAGCGNAADEDSASTSSAQRRSPSSPKKGLGLSHPPGDGAAHLRNLNVGWYYTWSTDPRVETDVRFVPMVFSPRRLDDEFKGRNYVGSHAVLGFNEPNHEKQADVSVAEALAAWPRVASLAPRVGAPAMAGSAVKGWLPEFMAASPKVDFVTVHWYGGADASKFIASMKEVYDAYGLPIWVTEFACQTHGDSVEHGDKFTQEQVDNFIRDAVAWMERDDRIERYAWHDSGVGTSALFESDGSLTRTARTYAAAR